MNNTNVRNLKGEKGAVTISGGNSKTGEFAVIQCLTASTLNGLDATNWDTANGTITGQALPAGTVLYGNFQMVSVQAGLVACYNKA